MVFVLEIRQDAVMKSSCGRKKKVHKNKTTEQCLQNNAYLWRSTLPLTELPLEIPPFLKRMYKTFTKDSAMNTTEGRLKVLSSGYVCSNPNRGNLTT